jgi:hypothetical protein
MRITGFRLSEMKRNVIFILLAALLLTPWPVAYAYGDSIGVNSTVQIVAAEQDAMPKWNAYGGAIGSVIPGDLFYIDTDNATVDNTFTLYITNTNELVQDYRYITLNIGIYIQKNNGEWEKITPGDDYAADVYLTMKNGQIDFTLPSYGNYIVTIDKGCFYCYGAGRKNAVPTFYLTMN